MSKLDVKVGDKIKCRHNHGNGFDLHTVIELTATLAKCERDIAFYLRDGLKKGTAGEGGRGWNRRYGFLATTEEVAAIALANRITSAQWAVERRLKVTPENLAAVEALLAPKPQQEGA